MAKLAHNLDVRRSACKASYPGIVVGWIGDAAHQNEQSDHNPDSLGIVHADDFMATGAHAQAIVTWLLRNPADLEYVIHNRVIWTRSNGFKPKKYTGSDPHTNHVHASGKHGSVGKNSATGTGYDVAAENMTPIGSPTNPAGTPKPPVKPAPVVHAPGSRTVSLKSPAMTGDDVEFIYKFIGKTWCGAWTGSFNANMKSGVKKYQEMRGIGVDGIVGHDTWSNMGVKFKG
jgi:murein L,D-transpeptidase YcbB/YkuD